MARSRKCKRRGCHNDLPRVALLHNDPYCSTVCFRVDHGRMTADEAASSRKMSAASAEAADAGRWRRQAEATFARAAAERK
jgi:endogenous inhibitor of DNA gyrase (YacG/DUF329 family)